MKSDILNFRIFTAILYCLMQAEAHGDSIQRGASEFFRGTSPADTAITSLRDNPANTALARNSLSDRKHLQLRYNIQASLEYGNVDDLFDTIDALATAIDARNNSSEPGTGSNGGGGSSENSANNFWDDINVDIDNPDIEALTDELASRATRLAAATALVATEGYARGELSQELSALFAGEFLRGSWKIQFDRDVLTSAVGLADAVDFNPTVAKAELQSALDLQPTAPETRFDLSGGLVLTVNPANGKVNVKFNNDSLLLTKAAKISDFTLTYANEGWHTDAGDLLWGATLKYRQVALTQLGFRIGDLTDSKELFDTIDNANFTKDGKWGMDLGLTWVANSYNVGFYTRDLFIGDFTFPQLNTTNITSPEILALLEDGFAYEVEPQFTLEAGKTFHQGRWSLNGAVQGPAVRDPLGQEYQWASLQANFYFENWLLSNLNVGMHQNLAGTELSYATFGMHFLKFLTLEASSALETTEIDGDELPRSLALALGFNVSL